jgi:putative DNA primase/helicase
MIAPVPVAGNELDLDQAARDASGGAVLSDFYISFPLEREPDRAAIAAFVEALFRYADEGTWVSLRAFHQTDGGQPPHYIEAVPINGADLTEVIEQAIDGARYAANSPAPLVFCPPIATFHDLGRAAESNLACGLTLSVELDHGNTLKARARLEFLLGPATVVVASGGTWTDPQSGEEFPKLHLHWRLSEPTRAAEDHAKLKHARRLACALVDADASAVTPVHPLRWPGSWHLKGAPRVAQIVALNSAAEIHLPLALERLEDAAEAAGMEQPADQTPHISATPRDSIVRLARALPFIPNNDEPWAVWIKIGLALWRATGGSQEGLQMWIWWSARSRKFTPGACEERWAHFFKSPPTRIGAGTIFFRARQAGWEDELFAPTPPIWLPLPPPEHPVANDNLSEDDKATGAPANDNEDTTTTEAIEAARASLRAHVRGFLTRAQAWHAAPANDREGPEHAALAATLGIGKSTIARAELPAFITTMKALKLVYRLLWTVPFHRLGRDAELAMQILGLHVATWRGRDAADPEAEDPDTKMCLDPDAVADALAIGADIEQSVCGNPDSGTCCPFHRACGYQRQKAIVAAADVTIAAHSVLFHALPAVIEKDLALIITDEAWWQVGLKPPRATKFASFTDDLFRWQVLRDASARYGITGKKKRRQKGSPLRQMANESATSELHEYATKARGVFEATPEGNLLSRDDVERTGLTAAECALAVQLEWQRKVESALTPGMTPEARKAARRAAAVNATLPRRAGIWRAIEALLSGTETHTGRLESTVDISPSGSSPVIALHDRTPLCDAVLSRPILVLDATLPALILKYYLPRLAVLADLHVATPHCETFLITGGWGKTSLTPHPRISAKENARREGRLGELRDFVAFYSGDNALIVTYDAIEDRFATLPSVRTGHFNAIAGLDTFGDVRSLFVIGRPLPQPTTLWRMVLALTGKPIAPKPARIESRGQRMADGSTFAVQVRAYSDPDLEALRTAITDAAVLQAAGRGRGVNRTPDTPLRMFILADVVLPMPVKAVLPWSDVRPTPSERMAARGLLLENATDASRDYPDLFPTPKAAEHALARDPGRGRTPPIPYRSLFIGKWGSPQLEQGHYRPQGAGHKPRRFWVADRRRDQVRADLEAALGPLAMFDLANDPPAEDPAPSPTGDHTPPFASGNATTATVPSLDPADVVAMSDADKLALRARLQAGHRSSPDASAPEVPGSYGELLPPGEVLLGWRLFAPPSTAWKLHRPARPPLEVVGVPDEPDAVFLIDPEAAQAAA